MFPYKKLHNDLRLQVIEADLYDLYRLVDIRTHEVYEYSEGQDTPVATGETCHHIWGTAGPCANCTSRACLARNQGIMKIESLNNRMLFIYSTPVKVGDASFALELIKDVTTSFMIPDPEEHDNIEIVQMIRRFNDIAVRDSFTKLYNKMFVMNQLHTDMEANDTVAFIMFDLDLFKNINDRFGHVVGDEVLLYLAQHLDELARGFKDGWAARFGGDEFVLCAPHGIDSAGHERIEEMLERLQSHKFEAESVEFTMSVSSGIAYQTPEDTPITLIDRSDEEMYKQKNQRHKEMGVTR